MLLNQEAFLRVYSDVFRGRFIYPRGTECIEAEDYLFGLNMDQSPLTSFRARNLNLNYAKEEFKWYVRADAYDQSIEQHASMWQKIQQPDGSYFSNYGQYIFPEQFQFVVDELKRDVWSRRATIVLLKPEHLFEHNKDVVCTYSMNFRIRGEALNMSVNMRSNDVIFGMTNDVFCFSMIYRMVYALLVEDRPLIGPGRYVHKVDSLHVYSRHYDMIQDIIKEGPNGYYEVDVPWPTANEVRQTLESRDVDGSRGAWSHWLNS